jgi:hypothetical protein
VPTYSTADSWQRHYQALTPEQKTAFKRAAQKFVADLKRGHGFRPGLRIKGIQALPGCYALTWADDGRAIWSYGAEQREGEAHILWIAIGTHDILP